ncbi:MAG: SH3 domain-containing protein [Pseudomonadota bacterium]
MRAKAIRFLGGGLCLALACTLAGPSPAEARGHGGWAWALPLGAAAVAIAGLTYYTHAGVYYRPAPGGYMVVPPPMEMVPPPVGVMAGPPAPMVASAPNPVSGSVVVNSPSLNVRSGPGYNYPVLTVVGQGLTLEVIGNSQQWLSVRTPSGQTGWVDGQFTTPAVLPPQG